MTAPTCVCGETRWHQTSYVTMFYERVINDGGLTEIEHQGDDWETDPWMCLGCGIEAPIPIVEDLDNQA